MGYPKNYKRTYLYRHRMDVVEELIDLKPGCRINRLFETKIEAIRFRDRIYAFSHSYYGYLKFIIYIEQDDPPRDTFCWRMRILNLLGDGGGQNENEGDQM